MSMYVLGLDIGGANIKIADADGNTAATAFPMWTDYQKLSIHLTEMCDDVFRIPDMVALTMTAELADCFETKQEGVEFVIDAVQQAFPGVPLRVWLTTGEFAEPDDARQLAVLVSAANWHALATWVGRAAPSGPSILLDVGSTTTDIIPIYNGRPVPAGLTDLERMLSGELVYSGIGRTPVFAIARTVPYRDRMCPVAAEAFATIADAMLILEMLQEDEIACDTADGRGFTRECAARRLAHAICCDTTELRTGDILAIAESVVDQAVWRSVEALTSVYERLQSLIQEENHGGTQDGLPTIILSGSGAFFADFIVAEFGLEKFATRMSLPEMFHRPVSGLACAFAVARLAYDRCRDDLLDVSPF